jgi:hypothetical protein
VAFGQREKKAVGCAEKHRVSNTSLRLIKDFKARSCQFQFSCKRSYAMETNTIPFNDTSINTTGCCSKFNPNGWDAQDLHFQKMRFVRATTRSLMHVPLNMGRVFARVLKNIESAGAIDPNHFITLSRELSAFEAEHLFAVTKDVPGEEMVSLSGHYITKVFEGSFRETKNWMQDLESIAKSHGQGFKSSWFYYTTCPNCAKVYGKNYVVGLTEI